LESNTNFDNPKDEISLKEIIRRVKSTGSEIKKNWLTLLIVMLPIVGVFNYLYLKSRDKYSATLTFMLNEEKGGGSLGSILGQFGGMLGGTENSPLAKILELSKSRRIITSSIFEKITIEGKSDFIANHIIRYQKLDQSWESDKDLKGFIFTNGDFMKFSRIENKALLSVFARFSGEKGIESIFSTNMDKKTEIMKLSLTTFDETLSINLLTIIYDKISAFYIQQSIAREQSTLKILATKRDSIVRALNSNDYTTAKLEEVNNSLLYETPKVPLVKTKRNNQLLSGLYYESVKNAELADFALKSSTPYLTLIDGPIPPIKPKKEKLYMANLKGIFLGLFLGILFILLRNTIRQNL
jgi:hypothetical protein